MKKMQGVDLNYSVRAAVQCTDHQTTKFLQFVPVGAQSKMLLENVQAN